MRLCECVCVCVCVFVYVYGLYGSFIRVVLAWSGEWMAHGTCGRRYDTVSRSGWKVQSAIASASSLLCLSLRRAISSSCSRLTVSCMSMRDMERFRSWVERWKGRGVAERRCESRAESGESAVVVDCDR